MSTRHITLTLFLVFLFSCSPGKVEVSVPSSGLKPGDKKTTSPGAGDASGQSTAPSGQTASTANTRIYFERALTQGSQLDQLSGLNFMSLGATTTRPDEEVILSAPTNLSSTTILAGGSDRIVYLESDGLMASTLASTELSSLTTKSLYEFPKQAVSISISLAAERIAWIDITGAVFVTNFATGATESISLPEAAVRADLAPSGNALLVLTASRKFATYSDAGAAWAPQASASSILAAAWSKDGAHLAYVDAKGGLTIDGAAVATLASSDVHDLSWDGSALLYWTRLASGADEIRSLDPKAPTERTVTGIHVPASAGDGIVCPFRLDGAVYYSEYTESEYRIEKTSPSGPLAVAIPPTVDEGFICPSAEQTEAARAGQ